IDASNIRNNTGTNKYVIDIVKDSLSTPELAQLALTYRKLKTLFSEDPQIVSINKNLTTKKGDISDKELSVSLDATSKASWESHIVPHLDEIPLPLIGKGEQNSIKMKLAMDASIDKCVYLIEEPENHLSY